MITELDEKVALVLIDLQNAIVKANTAPYTTHEVLQNCNRLIAAFRKAGKPIILVNVNTNGAAWTKSRKNAAQRVMPATPTEDAYQISPLVDAMPDDIYITKHTWSAFYETELDEELRKRNITNIVLGGVATSIGVEGTARSASERGYNLTFISDAMSDLVAECHEKSLKYIFPRMGEVGTTNEVLTFASLSR